MVDVHSVIQSEIKCNDESNSICSEIPSFVGMTKFRQFNIISAKHLCVLLLRHLYNQAIAAPLFYACNYRNIC